MENAEFVGPVAQQPPAVIATEKSVRVAECYNVIRVCVCVCVRAGVHECQQSSIAIAIAPFFIIFQPFFFVAVVAVAVLCLVSGKQLGASLLCRELSRPRYNTT